MDKLREEFEKEYLASMNPLYFENEEQKKVYLKVNSDNNYTHDCTRLAYLWFVKGRETIVVHLPDHVTGEETEYMLGVLDELDKIGVKYE